MSGFCCPWEDPELEGVLAEHGWRRCQDAPGGSGDHFGRAQERILVTGPHGRWVGEDERGRVLRGRCGGTRYFCTPSAAILAVIETRS